MKQLVDTVAGVSTMWSLAAFAIVGVLYLVLRRKGKVPAIGWAALAAIVVLGSLPIVGSLYVQVLQNRSATNAIYSVRVTVLDPQGSPSDKAKVWSSFGGEAKRVEGGWQFDIPKAAVPANHNLTVHAAVPSAFLRGHEDVRLADETHPNVTIRLNTDRSAKVRGIVVDGYGRAVSRARVSVVGYSEEGVLTDVNGNFTLEAHAADGQQVEVHCEKRGLSAVNQWHPAGEFPAHLVLRTQAGKSP